MPATTDERDDDISLGALEVAGVAPLVQADPDERGLVVLWTLAVCAAGA